MCSAYDDTAKAREQLPHCEGKLHNAFHHRPALY